MGKVNEPMNSLVQITHFLFSESGGMFKVCGMSLEAPFHLLVQTPAARHIDTPLCLKTQTCKFLVTVVCHNYVV